MLKSMSLNARREMLASLQQKYRDASWVDKGKILDGFVASTGYTRKYAIQQLNSAEIPTKLVKRPRAHVSSRCF